MKIENNFRWDSCPLCNSRDIHKLQYADYGGKIKYSTMEIDLCYSPEIWTCNKCYSGFTQNILHQETSEFLYSTSHAEQRWSSIPFDQHKTSEVINIMTEVFTAKPHVLDIGCNTGELLDFAKTFGCITSGLEYSDTSCNILRNKGHNVYQSFDEVTENFEIITAFDLVEHLYDVQGFISNCYEKLIDGGKLIILTGDIHSVSAIKSGAHWWYAQYPEHIVFPSKEYYRKLDNFRLEKWLPTYASINYVFSVYRVLLSRLKSLITRRKYNGMPSLSPDHALIVLTKSSKDN